MAPGEYECELQQSDCSGSSTGTSAALRFSRELWSRQFVLKSAAPELLARSESHATLHPGHVLVSIDGVAVSGLSMRRFTELWIPDTSAALATSTTPTRVVRFCDRKRADLELAMIKDLVPSGSVTQPQQQQQQQQSITRQELSIRVAQCQARIWSHKLQDAQSELLELTARAGAADPLVLLLRLEIELIRVIVSNDALVVASARQLTKQTLAWLQALSELPSLSRASALVLRVALAEALLLSCALQFIAEKTVKAMTQLRRCAALYAELSELVDAKAALLLPASLLGDLKMRVRFGVGVLRLASVTALQGLEWLGAIAAATFGGFDAARALGDLLRCCRDPADPRCAWASLALFHCSSAIRMLRPQQQDDSGCGDSDDMRRKKIALQVAHAQQQALMRLPHSVLHLWSASLSDTQCEGTEGAPSPLELLGRAVALSQQGEQVAHLLRFDFGYRHFVSLNCDASTPLFMEICKCASAPSKLRGLCSVFLAASYLFTAPPPALAYDRAQLLSSVRLLLRSSLRFLDDAKLKDAEAACLVQRMAVFASSPDWYLHLLPCEILYVYCFRFYSSPSQRGRNQQQQLHERALSYLDRFRVHETSIASMGLLRLNGKVIKLNASRQPRHHHQPQCQSFSLDAQAICEWSVLRASVLFHLGDLESAQQQLETLQELLPQVPSSSFVPALASFYRLQIHWRRSVDPADRESSQEPEAAAEPVVLRREHAHFEYSCIYADKLRALAAVLANSRKRL